MPWAESETAKQRRGKWWDLQRGRDIQGIRLGRVGGLEGTLLDPEKGTCRHTQLRTRMLVPLTQPSGSLFGACEACGRRDPLKSGKLCCSAGECGAVPSTLDSSLAGSAHDCSSGPPAIHSLSPSGGHYSWQPGVWWSRSYTLSQSDASPLTAAQRSSPTRHSCHLTHSLEWKCSSVSGGLNLQVPA